MAFVPVVSLPSFTGFRAPRTLPSSRLSSSLSPMRMIATEPSAPAVTVPAVTPLTPRAVELLSYIRGHKSIFRPGVGFNSTTITLFRKSDTGRLFTPPDELSTNAHVLPAVDVAAFIHDNNQEIVESGVAAVVAIMPEVDTDDRLRDILHHNFKTILRAVSYAAAVQVFDFVHENNIGMMRMLHEELGVSSNTIATAVEAMRDIILTSVTDADLVKSTTTCFEIICEHLG